MSRRTERVNELLREELAEIIRREVKDPGIGDGLLSLTEVRVSPDLRRATVYVSYFGTDEERDSAVRTLQRASHFLHRELQRRVALRNVPELVFVYDPSIERAARLTTLIHEAQPDTIQGN